MTIPIPNPHIAVSMLAFLQGTQLNLFERFLTQAVAGIDSTSITSGMQNVAYVVLLVAFSGRSINPPCTAAMCEVWNQSDQVHRHRTRDNELWGCLHNDQPGIR